MSSRRARAVRTPGRSPAAFPTDPHARALSAALAAHQRGELEAARMGYTRILEQQPEHFDALHLLGVVAVQAGQPDVGETLIGLALQVRPRSHEALGNLALALKALGRTDEAEVALRAALALSPNFVDALRNLASILQARGARRESIALLERAVRAAPGLAATRANLGALLLDGGDPEAALPHLRHAVGQAPNDANAWANLGRAALDLDRIDDGLAACERALQLAPDQVPARVTLSALERVRGHLDTAEAFARAALSRAADERGARVNLATALADMARYEEAMVEYERLLAVDPTDVEAHTSLAAVALAHGLPQLAWPHHAWRWRLPGSAVPQLPRLPAWDGSVLGQDATLYVWPEQGIGDEIVFASTIPELSPLAGGIVLGCDPRLTALFARSFPGVRVVPVDEMRAQAARGSAQDRQCSIVDLGPILRPTLAAFPKRTRYLQPDPKQVAHWGAWLDSLGEGMKVGFSWRSQNRRAERRLACSDLAQWGPIIARRDIQFICLQYDECEAELKAARSRFGVPLHRPPGLDQRNDLDGVVALMAGLDLVVTAPTTVSTLAGAVGTPTWQLTRGVDWHGMGQHRSPWQPAVEPVYRPWNVDWDEMLARVGTALGAWAARQGRMPAEAGLGVD